MNFGSIVGDDRNFSPISVLYGERFAELEMFESYYLCTQHDKKIYDFDGRVITPGGRRSIQNMISSEKSPVQVPNRLKRPNAPIRMGKIIVDSFTNILFGENRFPNFRVDGDELTQDFVQTLVRFGRLPITMIRARTMGGSVGTAGLSWCFREGVPHFESHSGKTLHVHSWLDRARLLPKHVTEVYLSNESKWDGKAFNKSYFWCRRDWTPDGDFVFQDVPYKKNEEPIWAVDEEKSSRHGDGIVHFEWIQNLPSEEIDGRPDYDGLLDQFDQIDILNSVIVKGAILNLDPTLKLKLDPDMVNVLGIRKGSDNSLIVGTNGDADYLELQGTSIEAGDKLIQSMRRSILETAQCVVPDPSEVATQGVSSVTVKALYHAMLAKSDVLREQYTAPMKRILENIVMVVKMRVSQPTLQPVLDQLGNPAVDPMTGEVMQEQIEFVLKIPPRIEKQQVADPVTGAVTEQTNRTPRMPGDGGEVEPHWPPYFAPTYQDQNTVVTAMTSAAGGKAFLSVETATDIVSAAFGVDSSTEKKRLDSEAGKAAQAQADMFPSPAGLVPEDGGMLYTQPPLIPQAPVEPTQAPVEPFVPEA